MEIKKKDQVNLENKKGLFFQIGLVFALGLMILAFEWGTPYKRLNNFDSYVGIDLDVEMIPSTRQAEIKPPKPKLVEEIFIEPDETEELVEELDIVDAETFEDTKIWINTPDEEMEEPTEFVLVEEMPSFPGGEKALRKHIAKNVKYPVRAREGGIQGRIYTRFLIDTSGVVNKVSVIRSVDPLLDKEALRVVESLPNWNPGKQRGKKVAVWYTIPINFTLANY